MSEQTSEKRQERYLDVVFPSLIFLISAGITGLMLVNYLPDRDEFFEGIHSAYLFVFLNVFISNMVAMGILMVLLYYVEWQHWSQRINRQLTTSMLRLMLIWLAGNLVLTTPFIIQNNRYPPIEPPIFLLTYVIFLVLTFVAWQMLKYVREAPKYDTPNFILLATKLAHGMLFITCLSVAYVGWDVMVAFLACACS